MKLETLLPTLDTNKCINGEAGLGRPPNTLTLTRKATEPMDTQVEAEILNNGNRIRFRGADFYIVTERDEMMGGHIAHVYAVSVEDEGRLHGGVGGRKYPGMKNAGKRARTELIEAVEEMHYLTLRAVVYCGIAPADIHRAADRWIEMLDLEAKYTGPGVHCATVRIKPGTTDASLLTKDTVSRIIKDAERRLAQGRQNCKAEYDVANHLMRVANFADAPKPIRMALYRLTNALQARCNGHDIGVGAIRSKGSMGESWWDERG